MDIKTFMVVAVAALSVAACCKAFVDILFHIGYT